MNLRGLFLKYIPLPKYGKKNTPLIFLNMYGGMSLRSVAQKIRYSCCCLALPSMLLSFFPNWLVGDMSSSGSSSMIVLKLDTVSKSSIPLTKEIMLMFTRSSVKVSSKKYPIFFARVVFPVPPSPTRAYQRVPFFLTYA